MQIILARCDAASQVSAAVLQGFNAESEEPTSQQGPGRQNEPERVCPICKTANVLTEKHKCLPCSAVYKKFEIYRKEYLGNESVKFWDNIDR